MINDYFNFMFLFKLNQLLDEQEEMIMKKEQFLICNINCCCCGCGYNASDSNYTCSVTNKPVMAWCIVPAVDHEKEDSESNLHAENVSC